jgi:putative serine/threonine protein kinase
MKDIQDFRTITVTQGENGVDVNNPTDYPLIGKGVLGAVFRISRNRCVKIYSKIGGLRKEVQVLKDGQDSYLIPKLYEVGDNYIVMEYIGGPTLYDLMQEGEISEDIVRRILDMLAEMKRLKFSRIDVVPRHVIFSKRLRRLKLIDHTNSYVKEQPYPIRMLNKFNRLGLLDTFLDHVEHLNPAIYEEWKRHIPEFYKNRI